MDLVGHCVVAELSGVFSEDEVYGLGTVELMFLNYAHCHDWAYSHCWKPELYGELERTVERMRAHMICDWVIHYGTEQTDVKEKCGWVYQRMNIAEELMQDFFSGAESRGLLAGTSLDTSSWTKKQRLDFAHSFVEYALDILLSPQRITATRFGAIKDTLIKLASHEGYGSDNWALDLFDRLGVTSDRNREFIVASMHQMAEDAAKASCPEEFAVRTALHKYEICDSSEAVRYARSYLEKIAAELDESEILALCNQIGQVIREPDSIYTGSWQQGLAQQKEIPHG